MANKPTRTKGETAQQSLEELKSLAKILKQFDLSELEYETSSARICLRRERSDYAGRAVAYEAIPAMAMPAVTAGNGATQLAPGAGQAKDDGTVVVTSPFVGTFYRAPGPQSSAFVEVGQSVSKGQVLCIVEAMKLMNEIEAEANCKIVEILVKNAEPVEFGQGLFRVQPLA